ncbi:MAG: DUF192 domain-containing protein [Rhodopirellula sp. JB055]|uniref:DUF192 domain-containing protein n=1 Tax=Rhodopirellula sp. JB055 TaxID=3342846 RepID=UPI00370ADAEE
MAETFWQRLRGLQFSRPLEPGSGLLLRNCSSVHTMWMRFPLDLFFLNEDWEVLEVRRDVKPWRVVVPKAKDGAHVIEVAAGWQVRGEKGVSTQLMPDDPCSPPPGGERVEKRLDATNPE